MHVTFFREQESLYSNSISRENPGIPGNGFKISRFPGNEFRPGNAITTSDRVDQRNENAQELFKRDARKKGKCFLETLEFSGRKISINSAKIIQD